MVIVAPSACAGAIVHVIFWPDETGVPALAETSSTTKSAGTTSVTNTLLAK